MQQKNNYEVGKQKSKANWITIFLLKSQFIFFLLPGAFNPKLGSF
jgi:hypothetical protein